MAILWTVVDASGSTCPPTVNLVGDAELVAHVAPLLRRDGIATRPTGACSGATVRLTAKEGQELVHVVDAQGRESDRLVDGPAVAVAVIESWVRSDLTASLLAPPASQPAEKHPQAPIAGATIGARLGVATDGSIWVGAELAADVTVGPLALGARADLRHDTATGGNYDSVRSQRNGGSFLVDVIWPLTTGSLRFAPWAGLGARWDHVVRTDSPTTGSLDRGGPSFAAGAALGWRLTGSITVELAAEASWAPLADIGLVHDQATDLFFAGEPRAIFSTGFDLRIGSAP